MVCMLLTVLRKTVGIIFRSFFRGFFPSSKLEIGLSESEQRKKTGVHTRRSPIQLQPKNDGGDFKSKLGIIIFTATRISLFHFIALYTHTQCNV